MNITIIDDDGENYIIDFKKFEYPNLMELIINTYYSEVGECKSRGLCATCAVTVIDGYPSSNKSQLETNTLSVHSINNPKNRLSCQILLDKAIDGAVFKINDHAYL